MKNYIGIDISKATLDVYDGKKSYKFKNNTQGFKQIISLSKHINETVFIFEPTGVYSYALSKFCSKNKIGVVMVGLVSGLHLVSTPTSLTYKILT